MRSCTLLFGSMARGDGSESSDIDLLVSEPTGKIFSERIGRIEVQYTPQAILLDMAAQGNLFAAHLVFEAKPISDPDDFLGKLRDSFKAKESYEAERAHALSLAAFLRKRRIPRHQQAIKNKRIAWSVRTTLISLLAEKGKFVFSPSDLVKSYQMPFLEEILSCRRKKKSPQGINKLIEQFLLYFDGEKYLSSTSHALLIEFYRQRNSVALATVKNLNATRQKAARCTENYS